jgi:hypothetical protein
MAENIVSNLANTRGSVNPDELNSTIANSIPEGGKFRSPGIAPHPVPPDHFQGKLCTLNYTTHLVAPSSVMTGLSYFGIPLTQPANLR